MAEAQNVAALKSKMVNVTYGPSSAPGAYAGMTVAEVRAKVAQVWGVPADAQGMIGKTKLEDDHVLEPGDQLTFHRKLGEKGMGEK